ncbi:MAG: polysaccharide lyase 6 family protein [Mucilaginibacter sp.]|uniref:polysaccharide lyase 6 family protein n=1 Tax=Mucilaginibacter sp. TaxID=1882438 RepID=UPI003265B493
MRSKTLNIVLACIVVFLTNSVFAQNIKVASIPALQTAISKAKPGDVITLANGVYTTTEDIVVDKKGTQKQTIVICAETIGNAEITGQGGFNLASGAAYITIKGFKFTHKASKAKTAGGSSFCRWTQNIFENVGDGEDLTIAGSDHEVDYNTFQNKNAMGRFLAIRGTGKQIAERLNIHHNYFNNFTSQGGKNGAEAFQFGLSGFSLSTSNSIAEYNLFENCAGENELISVKASGVTLRYNTVSGCPAQFTLRHGNKSVVQGNYFINTPGLRIFGDDHLITGNYFENCKPAITIGNGDGEVADGAQLTAHDRPDRVLITYNTLINNAENYVMTQRKDGMGATNTTFANNIIQGGGEAAGITGPYPGAKWEGNIVFNTKPGAIPDGGYALTDPKLVKTPAGYYLPVSANANLYYPNAKTTPANHILKPEDVGYKAVK